MITIHEIQMLWAVEIHGRELEEKPRLGHRPIHLLLQLDWRSCGTCQCPHDAIYYIESHWQIGNIYIYVYIYIYICIYIYIHIHSICVFYMICSENDNIDVLWCSYVNWYSLRISCDMKKLTTTWVSDNFPASMALTKPMSISWQKDNDVRRHFPGKRKWR